VKGVRKQGIKQIENIYKIKKTFIQVNQQLVLEIPVEGAPAPETVWLKNDVEVKSDEILRVAHATNCAKLMFIPARR
jgi:hypothetical protein